nr:hypothetical protein [uncultured Desulfobacter sp.]
MTDEPIYFIVVVSFLSLILGRAIYYWFWIRSAANRICSRTWCPNGQEYSRKDLMDTVIDITKNTNVGLSIIKHTTAKINTFTVPIIYGDINFPTIYGKPGNRRMVKGFYSFSAAETMQALSLDHPNVFEFAYDFGNIQLFFINRIKSLEKLLLTSIEK